MLDIVDLIRNGEYYTVIIITLARCFVVFCCLPIHELAHGWMADKLGDHTARNLGRLTLNPLAHLNFLGTFMIFFFGVGYAKPVPITSRNLKNVKRDMALIALAGPCSNLILGGICAFLYTLTAKLNLPEVVLLFFYFAASVNISLAVFNLIPVPPLDGSKVLASILPNKIYVKYMQYERYVMYVLIALLVFGVLDGPISAITNFFMSLFFYIPQLILGV